MYHRLQFWSGERTRLGCWLRRLAEVSDALGGTPRAAGETQALPGPLLRSNYVPKPEQAPGYLEPLRMKDYAFAQKAEFVAGMKQQLAALNRSLDELGEKIEKSSSAAKAEAQPKLAALREEAAALHKQLEAVESSSVTTWDGVKADTQKAYGKLKDGFATARQWVSDKIAP